MTKTILIGYDLNGGGAYSDLIAAIKAMGAWWHHLESTWVVKTTLSPKEVRDRLRAHLDRSDELIAVDITGSAAAWTGFNESGSKWLKDNL